MKNLVLIHGAEFWVPISLKELARLRKFVGTERLRGDKCNDGITYWHVIP